MTERKSALFVFRHFLVASGKATELLNIAMTAAAFDMPVTLLFMDDAVWALKRKDWVDPAQPAFAMIEALAIYGVDTVLVEHESLLERTLSLTDLAGYRAEFPRAEFSAFVVCHDLIWSDVA